MGREGKILLIEFFKPCWSLVKDRCNQWLNTRAYQSNQWWIPQEESSLID